MRFAQSIILTCGWMILYVGFIGAHNEEVGVAWGPAILGFVLSVLAILPTSIKLADQPAVTHVARHSRATTSTNES